MWDEKKDFEILDQAEEYDVDDESSDDFLYLEVDPTANEDGNENSDVFEYEADFYYDEEDE